MRRSPWMVAALAAVVASPAWPQARPPAGVRGSRAQIHDGWIATDAAVYGTYLGPDSALGQRYHAIDVTDVWMGTPVRGRLVFKAPRGIRVEPGTTALLLLWDRLAGAFEGYLDESQRRFGDHTWEEIGPDSLASYLLPFPLYAYPFTKDKLVLRGRSAFRDEVGRDALKRELRDLELRLVPERQFRDAGAVVRARAADVQQRAKVQEDVVLERRIIARFAVLETYKGSVGDSLRLEFGSFPRSPRFLADEEVILFLNSAGASLRLPYGKRSVYHVEKGEVVEAGRPLAEFVKQMRGS